MSNDKIIDLETRMAFQDDTIQQLNDVIYRQQQQINKLEKMVELIVGKMQDISSSLPTAPQDEKPPHY